MSASNFQDPGDEVAPPNQYIPVGSPDEKGSSAATKE